MSNTQMHSTYWMPAPSQHSSYSHLNRMTTNSISFQPLGQQAYQSPNQSYEPHYEVELKSNKQIAFDHYADAQGMGRQLQQQPYRCDRGQYHHSHEQQSAFYQNGFTQDFDQRDQKSSQAYLQVPKQNQQTFRGENFFCQGSSTFNPMTDFVPSGGFVQGPFQEGAVQTQWPEMHRFQGQQKQQLYEAQTNFLKHQTCPNQESTQQHYGDFVQIQDSQASSFAEQDMACARERCFSYNDSPVQQHSSGQFNNNPSSTGSLRKTLKSDISHRGNSSGNTSSHGDDDSTNYSRSQRACSYNSNNRESPYSVGSLSPEIQPVSTLSQATSQRTNELNGKVVDVFIENFFEAIETISSLVQAGYNHIAMDTEFPGDVYQGNTHYDSIRQNSCNLKMIQLGITLSDKDGKFPEPACTWQFNFSFNLHNEKYNPVSIELLIKSGIDFPALAERGIPHKMFAEYTITSGLLANPSTVWYGFHTDHDFAYLLKTISGEESIPEDSNTFLQHLAIWFPTIYDLKSAARYTDDPTLQGGLAKLAYSLCVDRDDNCEHQAGSDSKLTARCFFALRKEYRASLEATKGQVYPL